MGIINLSLDQDTAYIDVVDSLNSVAIENRICFENCIKRNFEEPLEPQLTQEELNCIKLCGKISRSVIKMNKTD
ncbi:hypothetical protein MHBO_002062 [Bonamia ostreae]|uniref:Uncharacterized protein n=1 Tax=Bonamia ostreae TaxID=126728 RepID=A0ABV2AL23_9EUKA